MRGEGGWGGVQKSRWSMVSNSRIIHFRGVLLYLDFDTTLVTNPLFEEDATNESYWEEQEAAHDCQAAIGPGGAHRLQTKPCL